MTTPRRHVSDESERTISDPQPSDPNTHASASVTTPPGSTAKDPNAIGMGRPLQVQTTPRIRSPSAVRHAHTSSISALSSTASDIMSDNPYMEGESILSEEDSSRNRGRLLKPSATQSKPPKSRTVSQVGHKPSSLHRQKSRARQDGQDTSSAEDEDEVFAVTSDVTSIPKEDDDEVQVRDRGEELVRKRMKERKREKKEAERRERRRREEGIRKARDQRNRTQSFVDGGTELAAFADQPPFTRRSTYDDDSGMSTIHPSALPTPNALASPTSGYFPSTLPTPISPRAPNTESRHPSYRYSSVGDNGELPADPFAGRAVPIEFKLPKLKEPREQEEHEYHPDEQDEDHEPSDNDDEDEDEDDEDRGDVEYTLKDRQDAINIEHPFGLPIWKPALYKKSRSVTRNAETALHSDPSIIAQRHLLPGNIVWSLLFGWWLCLVCFVCSVMLLLVPWGGQKYASVIYELAGYLFWPFGNYVEHTKDHEDGDSDYDVEDDADDVTEGYSEEGDWDVEHTGRTLGRRSARSSHSAGGTVRPADLAGNEREPLRSESTIGYGATQSEDKTDIPSGSSTVAENLPKKASSRHKVRRVRALGRVSYWILFYCIIAPLMLFVCLLCWGLVFTIPMAKLLWVLVWNLGQEPLSLHFRTPHHVIDDEENVTIPKFKAGQRAPRHSAQTIAASKAAGRILGPRTEILLCTYKAVGLQYYKYTVDGVNIMFINLLPLIFFVIIDFFAIAPAVEKAHLGGFPGFIAAQGTMFILALLSVIPLSYFIGMAVASISAQSSIGMGATINATFGSIIEVILYAIALTQGKAALVEGSIVGSLLAGVLLMPGLSMCGGALRRKEQRFNAKSAGVTSTMLIMAIIGILTPTLFYNIYGTFQLSCSDCPPEASSGSSWQCRHCVYEHIDPINDPFYQNTVQKLAYYCAVILVLSYLIGLWFSLRTHASQIWQNQQAQHIEAPLSAVIPHQTPVLTDNRHSMYKKLAHANVMNAMGGSAFQSRSASIARQPSMASVQHQPPSRHASVPPSALKKPESILKQHLPDGMTADQFSAAVQQVAATAEALQLPPLQRQMSNAGTTHFRDGSNRQAVSMQEPQQGGGHDAPNWSRTKSYSVLFGCTVLYAIIAEILVDVVDVVLEGSGIPEKFLGITLFALVPNTTEFMNAISFAINGNIALSMEIGSAYALQVCLLQIPAMVLFTAIYSIGRDSMIHRAFTLVFPRWDVIAIMFSVFLLTYTYIEARSNYYRGTILIFSYLVLLAGFYFAPDGLDNSDTEPILFAMASRHYTPTLTTWQNIQALVLSIFTR